MHVEDVPHRGIDRCLELFVVDSGGLLRRADRIPIFLGKKMREKKMDLIYFFPPSSFLPILFHFFLAKC